MLLQLAVALHGQGQSLDDSIIFLDEPENHLHPSALREFLGAIKKHVRNGQVWVATHSVHVLAQADPSEIWYMEDGGVRYAGRTPEHVLQGLLGNEDEIGKLADFLSLPAQFASIQFAAECLIPPPAVMTGTDDQQTTQICKVLEKLCMPEKPLRVLDFGAGQGRLLRTLAERFGSDKSAFKQGIDYFAYDPSPEHAGVCRGIIEEHHGTEGVRYFNDKTGLKAAIDRQSVDVVVMCNVFHEIPPEKWAELFAEEEILRALLRPDGYLLIVEDQLIPVGEKAHQKGFLVLDELHFKRLFAIKEADRAYQVDPRRDGRLKAHLIPAEYLARYSNKTRREAIEELRETAKEQVIKLRDQAASYRNGKLHAFWTHQWVNAELALGELGR